MGLRVPTYTRFAPLFRAFLDQRLPIPRLAPVIRIVLSAIVNVIFAFGVEVLDAAVASSERLGVRTNSDTARRRDSSVRPTRRDG